MRASNDHRLNWRLRVYPLAILATLGVALLLASVTYDINDPESRLGGDYPSFYGAGSIVAGGDWDELYDATRQQEEQAGLIDDEGGYLYFSYPPFVAGVYGILATLGYQWSFLIHTVLMTAALAGAIWALWPWLRRTGIPGPALLVAALSFQPVFTAVVGGQNTALTLLLFSLGARLDRDDRPFLAGLATSLLLFKPQFGIVVLPLLVVGRRRRMFAGWVAGAVVLFTISTLLMGGSWVGDWWSRAGSFSETNLTANGANFISFPGFLANLFGNSTAVLAAGYGLAMLVAARVAWEWWRGARTLTLRHWALAAGAAMAVAPQTLFYDAGLLLLGVVSVLPRLHRSVATVAGLVAISWLQVAKSTLGWSPLGPVALVGFVLLLVQRDAAGQPEPTGVN